MASSRPSATVGPGTLGGIGGYGYTLVYRVVTEDAIECADCCRVLAVGEEFTRAKIAGGGHANYPFCSSCRPFKVDREVGV